MQRRDFFDERLTYSVIGAFFEVYNTLGFGFLEHIYVQALEYELQARGHRVGREVGVVVHYKDLELGGQRLDMIVDDVLVVETKSTFQLSRIATRQTYNYLRATGLQTAMLLHFGPEPHFFRIECHRHRRPSKHNQFTPRDQPSYREGEESSYPEDESV
ncbi:MAG TPA: GxxExxY protein [Gemmatimonadaceae bacterium]|nr:GxxExxY protein [Gemmatimonadaceae bacterium]